MADNIYGSFKKSLGEGLFDLSADTLKCALVTGAYTPSADHAVYADVAACEASGAGYTAGGQALADVTWGLCGTAAVLAAADPSWTGASVSARYAVIYADKTTGGLTGPLICLLDFGADKGVAGGTFRVAFDAAGIMTLG